MEHIVLAQEGKTALVFMAGHPQEYCIANHYYGQEMGWGFGNYFSDMAEAVIAYRMQVAKQLGTAKEEAIFLKGLVKNYTGK